MVTRQPPEIIDMEDFDESINMLIYGDSGVGKTVFGGSAPNVLFVATEKGTIAAKRQGSDAKVWPVETWEDVQKNHAYLKKATSAGDLPFNWVVMDSATAMQTYLWRAILDKAVQDNSNRDPDIPAIQDHQKMQNMYKRFIKAYCDLPVNVLFTATTARHDDEEGENIILPDITGKGYGLSQWSCAQMHVVGYMSVRRRGKAEERETVRRINFQTVPPYFGKDRYACLGKYNDLGGCTQPYLENVTLQEVTDLIAASGNPESKPVARPRRATTTTRRRRAS
jgi:hypothetical protein